MANVDRTTLKFLFRPAGGHSFYRGPDGSIYLTSGPAIVGDELLTLDTTKPVSVSRTSGFLLQLVEGGCTIADAVEAIKVIEEFGLKLSIGACIFVPETPREAPKAPPVQEGALSGRALWAKVSELLDTPAGETVTAEEWEALCAAISYRARASQTEADDELWEKLGAKCELRMLGARAGRHIP